MIRGVLIMVPWLALADPAPAQTTAPASQPAPRTPDLAVEDSVVLLTGNNALEARRIGARGLLMADTPDALQRVCDVLGRDEDPNAQLAICQELQNRESTPAELIEPILRLIDSPRKEVGEAAGRIIGQFKREEVVPRLKRIAEGRSPALNGRHAAIVALGRMGFLPDVMDALTDLLADPDPAIQMAVLSALDYAAGQNWSSPDEARTWWHANRSKDLATLLQERDARRERMLQLAQVRADELSRRLVDLLRVDYLQRPDPDKTAALLNLLGDPEPVVRGLGLELTNALMTDRKPVPAAVSRKVRTLLADPVPDLRRSAAAVLADIRDPADAALLLESLARESVPRVRAALVKALGRLGDASVIPVLQKAIGDPATEVAAEAILGLGLVLERVRDADAAKTAAINRIAARFDRLGPADQSLIEPLLETMSRLGDPRFSARFGEYMRAGQSTSVRLAAIRGAAALSVPALTDQITGLLSDQSAAVRLAAAGALGQCGRTDAHLDALLHRIEGPAETEGAVRVKAWESFVRIWQSRSIADQFAWVQKLAAPTDRTTAARRTELLTILDRELAEHPTNAELRPRILEALADAQIVLGQDGAALDLYERAMTQPGMRYGDLANRVVRYSIRNEQFDRALSALTRKWPATATATAVSPQTTFDTALEELRSLLQRRRLDAVAAFLTRVDGTFASQLPTEWIAALAPVREALAAARKAPENASTAPASSTAPSSRSSAPH